MASVWQAYGKRMAKYVPLLWGGKRITGGL
jgi:hypothetical protein